MSPFFANYGWNPRLGLEPKSPLPKDLSAAERIEALKAEAIADRFNEVLQYLRQRLTKAQRH